MEIICIWDCWGCDGIGQSQTVLAVCTRSNPPPCDNLGLHSTETSLKPCLTLMPCTGWNKHILWNISDYDQPLHTFTEVYMSCLSSACFLLQADTCCNIAYCCRPNKPWKGYILLVLRAMLHFERQSKALQSCICHQCGFWVRTVWHHSRAKLWMRRNTTDIH